MQTAASPTSKLPAHAISSRHLQIFALIFVVAAAVYSFQLGTDALGASEAFSAWAAAKPGIGAIVGIPVLHDPGKQIFYYVVLHYFTAIFGTSEIALRSVSVIFGLAGIALVFALGLEMFDADTALAATAIWAFNPLAVVFAHRARMYSMFIAVALAHLLMLWRVRSRPSLARAAGCGVLGAALLYTHMGGLLIVSAEVAMLIRDHLRKRRNPMVWISVALTVALFAPYIPIARTQSLTLIEGHWLDWIGTPHEYPLAIKALVTIVAAAAAAWMVFGVEIEMEAGEPLRWLLAWAILPALALTAGSIVVRPMFNLRYLAPATAAAALIFARVFATASVKWRNLAAVGVAVAGLIVLPFDRSEEQPWRSIVREISVEGSASEPVFFESGFVSSGASASRPNGGFPFGYYSVPFNYYFKGPNPRVVVSGFDPAAARASIEGRVAAAGGGWLISLKDADGARAEVPGSDHFKAVEKFRGTNLTVYRITTVSPAANH